MFLQSHLDRNGITIYLVGVTFPRSKTCSISALPKNVTLCFPHTTSGKHSNVNINIELLWRIVPRESLRLTLHYSASILPSNYLFDGRAPISPPVNSTHLRCFQACLTPNFPSSSPLG